MPAKKGGPYTKSLTHQQIMLSLSNLSPIAMKNIASALKNGDIPLSIWLTEQIIGKPTQKSQITGANEGPVQIENTLKGLLTTPEACDALGEFVRAVSARIPDAIPEITDKGTTPTA